MTGLVLFPAGDVVLLSGTAVGMADALGRAALVVAYMTA
ncbi:MAG: ABC transporter permease, partial [Actinobacteria bacterium]|nr:ABC transporter permease [Actinomycetota bacterium]